MSIPSIDDNNLMTVTVIYYDDESLELQHTLQQYPVSLEGRVVIPQAFKAGKSIVAICKGEIVILNKVGDRILSIDAEDE